MADYGSSDVSTTSLGANQFPISEVYVPNGTLTALEGGPSSTDLGGKKSAPASMYLKDGSDVTQGTSTDSPNANTVVGQLKQIQANTNGSATAANQTTANTSLSSVATNTSNTATNTSNINTATGTKTDSKATDGSTTAWSVIALLKGIIDKLLSTLAVTQSGTWTVQPGNTANTTAWKVDGSAVTQPVSGTVTANAGTGTFTNQQSNITTDYDTGAGTQTMTMYGMALPASGGSVAGGTASNPLRTDPTGVTVQPVNGTVSITANSAVNVAQVAGTTTDTNSGNKSAGTQRVVLATDQPTMTNPQPVSQNGTWTVQPGNTPNSTAWLVQDVVGTTGGSTPFHVISAANNNATSLKASAGNVYGYTLSNTNAAARYVKFYNKASSPAPATDNALIVLTIQVPANATVIAAIPEGMSCSTGIAFAAVANMSDTDNTSIGAGDLSIDIRYK